MVVRERGGDEITLKVESLFLLLLSLFPAVTTLFSVWCDLSVHGCFQLIQQVEIQIDVLIPDSTGDTKRHTAISLIQVEIKIDVLIPGSAGDAKRQIAISLNTGSSYICADIIRECFSLDQTRFPKPI